MARKTYSAEQIIGILREADVRLSQGEKVRSTIPRLGKTAKRWSRIVDDFELQVPVLATAAAIFGP